VVAAPEMCNRLHTGNLKGPGTIGKRLILNHLYRKQAGPTLADKSSIWSKSQLP
jgi:hypothetical protein